MAELRELQKDFVGVGEVKGFKFHQTLATEKGYIYEVETYPSSPHHFEVFKRKLTYGVRMNDKTGKLEADTSRIIVSYPKSTSFGLWAWSCTNEEHALKTYYQRVEKSIDDEELSEF